MIHAENSIVDLVCGIAKNRIGHMRAAELGDVKFLQLIDGGLDGGDFFFAKGTVFARVGIESANGNTREALVAFLQEGSEEFSRGDDGLLAQLCGDLGNADMDGGKDDSEGAPRETHRCLGGVQAFGEKFCLSGIREADGLELLLGNGSGDYGIGCAIEQACRCGFERIERETGCFCGGLAGLKVGGDVPGFETAMLRQVGMGESLGDDLGPDACGIAGSDEDVRSGHGADRIRDRRCCEGIDFFQ